MKVTFKQDKNTLLAILNDAVDLAMGKYNTIRDLCHDQVSTYSFEEQGDRLDHYLKLANELCTLRDAVRSSEDQLDWVDADQEVSQVS